MAMLGATCSPCCQPQNVPGCNLISASGVTVSLGVGVPDISPGTTGSGLNWVRSFANLYESIVYPSPRWRYITQHLYLGSLNGTHVLSLSGTDVPVFFTDAEASPQLGSIWETILPPHAGCASAAIALHIANSVTLNGISFELYINYAWGARITIEEGFFGEGCGQQYFLNRDLPCPPPLSDEQYRYPQFGPFPTTFPCNLTDSGDISSQGKAYSQLPILRGVCVDGGMQNRTGIVARIRTGLAPFNQPTEVAINWEGGVDIATLRLFEEQVGSCLPFIAPGCLAAGDFFFVPTIEIQGLTVDREGLPSIVWPSTLDGAGYGFYV